MTALRSPRSRLRLLIAIMAVVGAAAFAVSSVETTTVGPVTVPWWSLAALFAATEVLAVHVTFRRGTHSLSLSEIPLVVGLALTGPLGLVVARVLGVAAPLILRERQRGTKLAFNLVQAFLEVSLAVLVFRIALGGAEVTSPRAWASALVAVLLVDLVSAVAVQAAIGIDSGEPMARGIGPVLLTVLIGAVASTSVALLAVLVLCVQPEAAILLVVLAVVSFLAYRSHVTLSQGYGHLEELYRFTRRLSTSVRIDDVTATVLAEARELLRADVAELVLFARDHFPARYLALRGDDAPRPPSDGFVSDEMPPDQAWWFEATEGEAIRVIRDDRKRPIGASMREQTGLDDAMATPLVVDGAVIGVLIVGNRLDDVSTFGVEDLKLFEALANHAAVALANGRLMEQLRTDASEREYQALHDPLTDLPNRRFFNLEVDAVLAERCEGSVAVALLDLDRFKEVNDTLGHVVGDELLRLAGERLQSALRDDRATVARLGGDEFAVVLQEVSDELDALSTVEGLLHVFEEPFFVNDVALTVGASAGIALAPAHGDDASVLLQRADVAMYQAKHLHSGVELYAPERDRYSSRWLALVNELREAVDAEDIEVHYQPKAELASGEVIGVEALARWSSPRRGVISPEEFVPIAEHTGLIRPLTRLVLGRALRDCARWRADGRDLTVSVNVSSRSLLDPALFDDVCAALAHAGVPASALVLEITETSVVDNLERAVAVLSSLREVGVQLSIDDFGSGQASLAYLKHLPVDEVKIDKSFVLDMATDEHDAAIVGSTVELLHRLGLRVVAEGVENEQVWCQLTEMGCDVAQGYLLSRPVPAERLTRWLRQRAGAPTGATRVAALPRAAVPA